MTDSPKFNAIAPQIDLPAMEHSILDFWKRENIFEKSLAARAQGEPWTFYEGPPTANGMPGTHHIEARVFKDVFPRYQTMKGKYVSRKAGWDCHGLPVEIAVEKELGFSGKGDIEKFGIAEFNDKCKTSVTRHVDAFTKMTERMGFWVDFDQAYWTMAPEYVESVWWSLSEIWKKGLLVQDHRVAPYCPRCGTGLSDHELAQGYETVVDPSVYVRFPITSGELASYLHGAKIGVLVDVTAGQDQLGKDIAMHIAAAKPKALDASGVDAELIETERRVAIERAKENGKTGDMLEKIAEGTVNKFLKEVTLLSQVFIKADDGKQTVEQLLKSKSATINGFTLFVVGEGIEKKVVDYAAEVAAAAKV